MSDRKTFLKTVFAFVIPIALQNLINVGVTVADVLMLGQFSEIEVSGVSLAGQIQFVIQLIMFGLTSGVAVLTAQYWGKKDTRTIEKLMGISLRFAIVISLLVTLIVQLFPESVMRIFSNEEAVVQAGASYLRIVSLAYVLSNSVIVYLNIIRSIEKVVISTIVYASSFGINVLGNALLIFGLFGFPKLGVQGAAVATLTARIIEFTITAIYALKKNKTVRVRLKDILTRNAALTKDFLTYAIPVIINEGLWSAGVAMNSVVIGHMGSEAAAAASVAQMTRQIAQIVSRGVASATAVYLGKSLGAGNKEEAELNGNRFMKLTFMLSLIASGFILILRPILPHFLNFTQQSLDYFASMMLSMALYTFTQAMVTTLVVGVFRSGGDIRFPMYLDLAVMWLITIPSGAILAFLLNQSAEVVYFVLLLDETLKLPIYIWRYKKKTWLRDVTR